MMRFSYATGAVLALLAAGPSFIILWGLSAILLGMPGGPDQLADFVFALPLMLIATPVGMVVAAVPVLLAGYGLGRIATIDESYRSPWVWAGAGALIGGVMSALLIGLHPAGTFLFAADGAICALITRYGTRWFDEASA